MDWDKYLSIIATILGIIILPIRYIIGKFMARIEQLETEVAKRATKEEVQEKLDPIKDDLTEIKARVEKILDHLLDHD